MIIKIKRDELTDVTNTMKNNSLSLDNEINSLLEQIEKLKTVWKGVDATVFYDDANRYFNEMKKIPATSRFIGDFIFKINNDCFDEDEMCSKKLEAEVDDYVQDRDN